MELNELEKHCLEAFRRGDDWAPAGGGRDEADWISFGLRLLLDSGRLVRGLRLTLGEGGVDFKADGSPATRVEHEIEELLRERLATFHPDATVVGEETGGDLPAEGPAVAMDPIDGTWAFLGRTESFSTTLAVFGDGLPFLGMIGSPTTGEIAYATVTGRTRLLQFSLFGEGDTAHELPLPGLGSSSVLVNAHPSRAAEPLVKALYEAWDRRDVRMVRSPGGSPSWALLEAAKGGFVYVNVWSKRPAEAFDLAAGVLLVEGAGGQVMDLEGAPIDSIRHAGPFVASVDAKARQTVVEIAQDALPGHG